MTTRFLTVTRRRFLAGAAATGAAATFGGTGPYVSRASDRPVISHGVQSGDVSVSSGVVWARADRPARMHVEIATSDGFRVIRDAVFVDALPESDFTAKALIEGLPAGEEIFYRIRFQDLVEPALFGDTKVGHFRTAPADRRSVSFVWSGDTAGQGWGIDEARGGMRTYATMRANRPDFFIHAGDHVYADVPLRPEVKLADGSLWRNLTIEGKHKAAETLAEFRANWKYNLLDRNVLGLNAEVPSLNLWDDHEVTNNWWPEEPLTRAEHRRRGYVEKHALVLMARGSRAMREYCPMVEIAGEPGRVYRKVAYGPLLDVFVTDMRSYRGPNAENNEEAYAPSAHFLGPRQLAWLKRELINSRATWKVIAADMPLALIRIHDTERKWGSEGIAQGDGPPRGRELEIADLLSFVRRARIRNTVWLTADVHYTAAHYFDPGKAAFQDFEPFWEFVSGPLHAGTGSQNDVDSTFGPQVVFAKANPKGAPFAGPAAGLQFFGHVAIDGATEVMTVTLKDVADTALWSVQLEPKPG
jgi:alkaline phosphatase D